jgi:hypothetical protein
MTFTKFCQLSNIIKTLSAPLHLQSFKTFPTALKPKTFPVHSHPLRYPVYAVIYQFLELSMQMVKMMLGVVLYRNEVVPFQQVLRNALSM